MFESKLSGARRIVRRLRSKPKFRPIIHSSSQLAVSEKINYLGGRIVVGQDSRLTIEDEVTIDSDITIGDGCTVTFRKGSCLSNTGFAASNNSVVEFCAGAIINSPVSPRSDVAVDNGRLTLYECAHIMSSEVLVRFGGTMTIGRYTGIAYGSEIRCEEKVEIGAYGMISYGVCIYDTNTHSTDWRERRRRIEECYPEGVWEHTKPSTSPVRIGDDVWIGKEVTITKGTTIGSRCIVGTRSIVSAETINDDSIVVMSKARVIVKRTLEENAGAGVV